MLRFQRTGKLKIPRNPEGIMWAKKISEYVKANYPQATFQVYTESFGDIHAIHWTADIKDMATMEALEEQLRQDQQYRAMVKEGMGFFVDGSFEDCLMNLI